MKNQREKSKGENQIRKPKENTKGEIQWGKTTRKAMEKTKGEN